VSVRRHWHKVFYGLQVCAFVLHIAVVGVEAQEEALVDSLLPSDRGLPQTLARAPLVATEQTVGAVRWLSKRRQFTLGGVPYGITGLPFLFFSPNTGWNYGTRLHWADYRRRPYRYKLTLHIQRSTEGKLKNRIRLKVPRISGTGFGLRLEASLERNLRTRYYGLGNDSKFNQELVDRNSPEYIDDNYYYYILEEDPRILLSLLRHIYGPMSISGGLGLERTEVDQRGRAAFYLDQGTPDGVKDGFTGFLSVTLEWDSRDDDVVPSRGVFHEWSYQSSRNSLIGLFFEEINFQRYTFTDTRYMGFSDRLTFAHRAVFEVLAGEIPLYAYGEIGGSRRVKGLGGSHSLRGFDTQRFTDDVRFFSNAESRYLLHSMWFFRQYLEWYGVGYFDVGRVWPDLKEVGVGGMHWSSGGAIRLSWNKDFVIRFGVGYSVEQVDIFFNLGNAF
jgi:outer membrane protein assembly factor BamA